MRIALARRTVEFILVVDAGVAVLGRPFTRLAREVGEIRDPSFVPVPRAPKPAISDIRQVDDLVAEVGTLFDDVAYALRAAPPAPRLPDVSGTG